MRDETMNAGPDPGADPSGAPAAALANFARGLSEPVAVVFGTLRFRSVVTRWIDCAHAAGCHDYRIVCMDDHLLGHLRDGRAAARAVSYFDLFPDTDRVDIDAIKTNRERLQHLTPLRVRLFRALADHGVDFIHSDADAFWLRDPRPWLEQHRRYDLLCSQGSHIPQAHFERHGFALCAGFFLSRANARTRKLWAAVDARRDDYPSDQRRLNAVLLNDRQRRWRIGAPQLAFCTYWRPGRVSQWFRLPLGRTACERVCGWFGDARLRRRFSWLLKAFRVLCMVTSEEVIDGRFRGGLRVGVIPMSVVARVRIEGDRPRQTARLRVLHTVVNKSMLEGDRRRAPPVPALVRAWNAAARRLWGAPR